LTQEVEAILKREISKLDSKYNVTICGSYRRGLPTSGDIDVLLTHDEVSNMFCHFFKRSDIC
jgi:DNA polymerase/3'-5' exonuclease PolX